ncbi:hypothetical protein ABIE69_000683 [Rhodobacteraceae bacterium MBR-64]
MTMRTGRRMIFGVLAALLALSACADKTANRPLTLAGRNDGPDEFALLPTKPLQQPADLTALPEPTPGGANLTDPTPRADAIAALGGNPAVLNGGPAAADTALLAHTGRFGVAEGIRTDLAQNDQAFRNERRGFWRRRGLRNKDYFDAYADQSLNQAATLYGARAIGARTPTVQPLAVPGGTAVPAPAAPVPR